MTQPPREPPSPEDPGDPSPSRRGVLAWLGALSAGATGLLATVPALLHFLTPSRPTREVWRSVGRVEDFRIGSTVDVRFLDPEPVPWAGFAAESAALLRRTGPEAFVAFSPYCTHVGCPVRWDEGADLFLCPCHGGAYYRDGTVAAGPPPRPLVMHEVRVREGQVEIRPTSVPKSA